MIKKIDLPYHNKADRKEYLNALWNIVNWNAVNKRFEKYRK